MQKKELRDSISKTVNCSLAYKRVERESERRVKGKVE